MSLREPDALTSEADLTPARGDAAAADGDLPRVDGALEPSKRYTAPGAASAAATWPKIEGEHPRPAADALSIYLNIFLSIRLT